MVTELLQILKYNEAVELPKFKKSLDLLLNRKNFNYILGIHSVEAQDLCQFIEKAVSEGNAVLIEREYNGYMVIVWKD